MDRVKEIENAIDRIPLQSPALRNPLPYCLWYILTVHETFANQPNLTRYIAAGGSALPALGKGAVNE